MYKIVPITALTMSSTFISSDKILQISNDRTKMFIGENDYEHKNKFYLSTCIDNADRSLNAYLSSYNTLSNTYITSSLNDIYIENGNLITRELVDAVLSSDAFLTKDGCKAFEAECISYINELKNKAVSMIMTKLNASFIKQNTVKRPIYGQTINDQPFDYIADIKMTENFPDLSSKYSFDFKSGEFTLANLLFGKSSLSRSDLFQSNWDPVRNSFLMNESFSSAQDIINEILKPSHDKNHRYIFNAANSADHDFKIVVPKASFDFINNNSIPLAKLITFVLKNQIYQSITYVCNNYAALMISVPKLPIYTPES